MIDNLVISSGMSILCGLDRTAIFQIMLSRPVVAAPLTGLVLGDTASGLLIGALLELLWLGRLPMGAAIPPDDTQISIASTFLAIEIGGSVSTPEPALILLTILVAMPLGKVGVPLDQWARRRNGRLCQEVLEEFSTDGFVSTESAHLKGVLSFAASSILTFLIVVTGGWAILNSLQTMILPLLREVDYLVFMVFPLVGMSHLLANLNVNRTLTLFGSSFLMSYLLLWLV